VVNYDEARGLPQLRRRLLARIQRHYEIVHEHLSINGVELDFVRIADPDRVLDAVAEEDDRRERSAGRRLGDDELHLPYWAQLWDSAMGIAMFLTAGRSPGREWLELAGASVLDLGCGMGLAGAAAAARGANVLLADLESPALLFAALNTLPWRPRARARKLNWRTDRLDERFDLIVGADILYERQQWEHLDSFWQAHLKPAGSVLLGEPGRQTGDLFPEWIAARSWKLEHFEQPVPTRATPIRLFRLRR
jgi:predicted nicotinamide N-methyase